MATAYSKAKLSGASDGNIPITIAGTTSGGATTIHTAVSGTSSFDEVWVYAYNSDTADIAFTILIDTAEACKQTIPAQKGLYQCLPGVPVNNAKVVKGYAGTANKIIVSGWVNAITVT